MIWGWSRVGGVGTCSYRGVQGVIAVGQYGLENLEPEEKMMIMKQKRFDGVTSFNNLRMGYATRFWTSHAHGGG